MSYDIFFVNRRQHGDWIEALDALESAGSELPSSLAEAWKRIVPQAQTFLGDVELFEGEKCLQLTQRPSGLQLSIYGESVTITVPYWHSGDDAANVMASVHGLSALVQKETGLEGFDPQVGEPLAELSPPGAIDVMSEISEGLHGF